MQPITGLEKLAQQFSVLLLQNAGEDEFAPLLGGGVRQLVLGATDAGDMEGQASSAVVATDDQMRRAQRAAGMKMDDAERLASSSLLSAEAILDGDDVVEGAELTITISSAANRAVAFPIKLGV